MTRLLPASGQELPVDPPNAYDDDDQSPHSTAIDQLAAMGLVRGTSTRSYSPSAVVSRAQMASYLLRAYELASQRGLPPARDHFADDRGNTHEQEINKIASMQIASGLSPGTYGPDVAVRRDQMARFLAATHGCMRGWSREGSFHDPGCATYPDTEAAQALQGFEVLLEIDGTEHVAGQPVPMLVQACNRRDTALRQTFPQKDWFQLEARNVHLPVNWEPATDADMSWYDHRLPQSLDGQGYGERNMDPIHSRVSARHPRLVALTWFDGPQASPDDVVVWQPGECKTLDVGAWQQTNADYFDDELGSFDYPAHWRHRASAASARTTPGWHRLHLSWGGVEVGQTRRYLMTASRGFHLDGPRLFTTVDKQVYAAGEPVQVTVHACNDSGFPYREQFPSELAWEISVTGQLHSWQHRFGQHDEPAQELTWQPGECKSWSVTWDQRFEDGSLRADREGVRSPRSCPLRPWRPAPHRSPWS